MPRRLLNERSRWRNLDAAARRLWGEPAREEAELLAEVGRERWLGPRQVGRLVDASAEIRGLLERLGYSPAAERRWPELRAALGSSGVEARRVLLAELEGLLEAATRRRERARREVLAALPELRERADSESLAALGERVDAWLFRAQGRAAAARRRRLESLLGELAAARHRWGRDWPLAEDAADAFQDAAQEHARRYLAARWMHTPWITTYALANLLAAELAALVHDAGRSPAVEVLEIVWSEVAAGRFDAAATRRRLRGLEGQGLYLSSLAYSLLELLLEAPPTNGSPRAGSWELEAEGWPGPRDAAGLWATSGEIRALLEELGFAPAAEERWPELWRELKAAIEVEIPDFVALRRALDAVRAQMEEDEAPEEGAADSLAAARRDKRDDPLLAAVLAAGDDEAAVRRLLGEDPVERLLPFIEEIPFVRDGEVSWRVPVGIALLRKRPRDRERFDALLAEAEGLLGEARTRRRQQARQEVTDALARLRKTLEQQDGYLPRPLQALSSKLTDWLHHAHSPAALERRRALESLLDDMTAARQRWGRGWPLADAEVRAFRSAALEHARRYLEADWMGARALTGYVLSSLLAAELAPLWSDPESRRREPVRRLHRLWAEVASGLYDPRETQRRLRELEAAGLWVHSLAHALLRGAQ